MKSVRHKVFNISLLSLFLTCILGYSFAAQDVSVGELSVCETVSISNGLSNNGVTALFKDSRGYMWIATYDGLNCYNGYSVEIFKNNSNKNILPSNRVRAIAEDCLGRLWIGTDQGVVVYDYNGDCFLPCYAQGDNTIIRAITIVEGVAYCISESDGIFLYDMDLNLIEHSAVAKGVAFAECVLFGRSLFIASDSSVVEYNLDSRQYKTHLAGQVVNCNDVVLYGQSVMLLADSSGLYKIDIENNGAEYELTIENKYMHNLSIKSLKIDTKGGVWIGSTFDGLYHYPDYGRDSTCRCKYLENSRISDFFESENGDMWISTFDNGVFHYTTEKKLFRTPSQEVAHMMPLIGFIDQDRLLVKSNRNVYIYNTSTDLYEAVPDKLMSIFNRGGGHYFVDSRKRVWWFGVSGCYLYEFKSDKAYRVDDPKLLALQPSMPKLIAEDMNGDIWVSYADDLFRISINADDSIRRVESVYRNDFFADKQITKARVIYPDTKTNSIFIGTDTQGLYVIDMAHAETLKDVSIKQYNHDITDGKSLSSDFVSSIVRTPAGVMWLGTEQGGLCRVNEMNGEFAFDRFTEDDGLSNNVIKAIQTDSSGRLWIATNVGLNSFDVDKKHFKTYRIDDGLPFEEFLYSTANDSKGNLYFTGAAQLCFFNPALAPQSEPLPRLYFNGLNIYDREVKPNVPFDKRIIIKDRLSDGDNITLAHNKNTFSVGVDALYEENASFHHYHYILEPINTSWTKVHASNNKISFNGLRPGRYTLRVKASNSYGDMSPEVKLHFKIKPPFYNSVAAYIIYFVVVLFVVISVIYSMMHTQALQHSLNMEAQEKEHMRRANIEKQQYFSNISHELKTPLTLIMAPLSILSDRFQLDVNIKANLAIMQRQVRKMLQLIDLAHGVQLSDSNLLELKREKFVVRDFLKDISKDFEFFAEFDKKNFKVEYPDSVLTVDADRSMLEKVLNNLLNNAFKYTVAGDNIVLTYAANDKILTLKVTDDGAGVAEGDLPHIFERFYTSKSIETKKVGGTGIGLAFSKFIIELHGGAISAQSEYGAGTTFIVELPVIVGQKELSEYQTTEQVEEAPTKESMILGSLELDGSIDVDETMREKSVYVVEDNGEMRAFISDIVGRYFKVQSYASAQECLDAMEAQWPDIIVSDVMMPDMNGDRLCEIVKSDLRTSHIPVILLTARYTVDDKIKGIELGADSYIGKPFYPKHLITRISSLLRGRQRLFEHFQKGLTFKQTAAGGVSARDAEMLSSLYALFEKSLDDEMVELDSFAIKLGLNRSLFYSKIKALTDMSPYELMKNYRLQRANELLRSGEYNVNEVCDMTGFKSRTHFSRVFKQHFGVAPSKVQSQES